MADCVLGHHWPQSCTALLIQMFLPFVYERSEAMFLYDFGLILVTLPAVILAFVAQGMVKSAYEKMSQVRASMSGFQAARRILDAHGLYDVGIEQIGGQLSDHYDPSAKVLRLSPGVFQGNSMASVGIAAHEVGHAIQDAKRYAPLVVRNMAVPAANFGSGLGIILASLGSAMLFGMGSAIFGKWLLLAGIVVFSGTVFFQLVNLPVEFDASRRAKVELINQGIVSGPEIHYVSKVLNAAALTYVAATLQAVLTLLYFVFRFMAASRD